MEHPTKRRKKKERKDAQKPVQNRTAVFLLADETRMKPNRFLIFSFSFFFFLNQQKTSRPAGRWAQKKTQKSRRGPEVRLKGQVARERKPGVTSLPLASPPALRRLKRGKQRKKKIVEEGHPSNYTRTHAQIHTPNEKTHGRARASVLSRSRDCRDFTTRLLSRRAG